MSVIGECQATGGNGRNPKKIFSPMCKPEAGSEKLFPDTSSALFYEVYRRI
jgi:hypothetical protein